ncbi:hypothetical protein C7M84_004579 [Penaeus vannamei]|uniref:FAS1 domain-containing protein n=1 Tax=Penaeus vannamei TaxID=6689 RepID=A0A3R7P6G3_PENVA|nr:hypothetical protein C7M84_004579 [Penaeus vannamei]
MLLYYEHRFIIKAIQPSKNLIELAESRNLFTFVELVKKAGLEETLSHTGDYTFFVPDEAAWYSLDSEVLSAARRDLELAGQLVRFHGAYGRHLTNAITDNQAIMSLDEENPVRLQVWRRALGVEDAKITEKDIEAQNGVIHIINKVIVPSNQSVQDILRVIPQQRFNIFLEALQQASSQENSVLSLGPGDEVFYTFFVPPDSAFRQLNAVRRERRWRFSCLWWFVLGWEAASPPSHQHHLHPHHHPPHHLHPHQPPSPITTLPHHLHPPSHPPHPNPSLLLRQEPFPRSSRMTATSWADQEPHRRQHVPGYVLRGKPCLYTVEAWRAPSTSKKTSANSITVNGASVTSSHMSAKGVIHVIDKVFLPENSYTYSTYKTTSSSSTYKKTVT